MNCEIYILQSILYSSYNVPKAQKVLNISILYELPRLIVGYIDSISEKKPFPMNIHTSKYTVDKRSTSLLLKLNRTYTSQKETDLFSETFFKKKGV